MAHSEPLVFDHAPQTLETSPARLSARDDETDWGSVEINGSGQSTGEAATAPSTPGSINEERREEREREEILQPTRRS